MTPPAPGRTIAVDDELLATILAPYKEGCRYLKAAVVTTPAPDADGSPPVVRLRGELSIPESCYIDDTGHFNSVEFNLCFNQMFYTLLGQCVASGLLPQLGGLTLAEYLRRQLPDVLIHEFSSVFKRPMDSTAFRGEMSFDSVTDKRRFVFFKTTATFRDDSGGHCEGAVTLVLVNRSPDAGRAAPASAEARRSRG